jgi:hypothetical protein
MNIKFHFVKYVSINWTCGHVIWKIASTFFRKTYCLYFQSSSSAINMCISVTITHTWLRVDVLDVFSWVS